MQEFNERQEHTAQNVPITVNPAASVRAGSMNCTAR